MGALQAGVARLQPHKKVFPALDTDFDGCMRIVQQLTHDLGLINALTRTAQRGVKW